ncbi:MAG TPA: trigger factor [Ktedonobacterales bacterium]|nr:trigger factor [Ktedonobacterales bacterium]
MKVTVERTPESEAVLNVELEWSELEKASDRAYKRLVQQYNVPGFRKGHAPRTMLERVVGKEAIYHEGLDDLIETSYRDAVRDNKLTPLAQPTIDHPEIEMGKPYSFTARVPVLAPVELGDYKAIRVEQPDTAVSDEDVQKVVEQIRDNNAMWLPAERPARIGDQVTMDLKLTAGDRDISDLHDNEFTLADDREGIFKGMDEQIVGMAEGESKQFTTTIAEDYTNPDLAGKEAAFDVTLKAVKFRELPEIDDELAKSAGDYETVEGLRTGIREQLERQKQSEARRTIREETVKQAVEQATVQVAPVLVEDELDAMVGELRRMLEQSRMSFEQYLVMTQKTEEQVREEMEPDARERAKRDLVLNAIADAEQIEVTDAEVGGWLDVLGAMGGRKMKLNQLSRGQRANIANSMRRDKVIELLQEFATTDHPKPTDTATETDSAENAAPAENVEAGASAAAEAADEAATEDVSSEAAITEPGAAASTPSETDI